MPSSEILSLVSGWSAASSNQLTARPSYRPGSMPTRVRPLRLAAVVKRSPVLLLAALGLLALAGACADDSPGGPKPDKGVKPDLAAADRGLLPEGSGPADAVSSDRPAQPTDAASDKTKTDAPVHDQGAAQDMKAPVEAALLDGGSDKLASPEWSYKSYQGGFNPHTFTSDLVKQSLSTTLKDLSGAVNKTCTGQVSSTQMNQLTTSAAQVAWSKVLATYVTGGGPNCGYPGDAGDITVTLKLVGGGTRSVTTRYCMSAGSPLSIPTDLDAFLKVKASVEKAVCP